MRYFIICLILSIFLTFTSFAKTKPVVIVSEIKSVLLSKQLSYPARVTPEVNVPVLSIIDGVVTRVSVNLGETVKKGAPLVYVQHNEPGYQYKPMVIAAPVAGVISLVDVNPGASISSGQKLLTITDPKRIYIAIEIAAADLSLVSAGLQGTLSLPNDANKTIPVKITGISPLIDSATGTAHCQLRLVNSTDLVYARPGILGQVVFEVNKHKSIEVPESALVYRAKDTFVNSVQNEKIKEIKVTTGETHKGMVEILSGLKEKDVIVIRSSNFLIDGVEVTVETDSDVK